MTRTGRVVAGASRFVLLLTLRTQFPAGTQVPGRDVYRAILNPTFDTAWPSIGILAAIAGAMEVLKLLALQWAYHRGKL